MTALSLLSVVIYNTLHHTSTHSNLLQPSATYCNVLQHSARCSSAKYSQKQDLPIVSLVLCNTLQHTATHCNTLQHTATHCNTLQHTATHCNTPQHIATHCNTLHGAGAVKPVPDKLRLEIVIGVETRMVNAKDLRLFSNENFENRPRTIIQKSDFHPNNHFESHLLGNGL